QQIVFMLISAVPDGSDRVDDEAGGKVKTGGDARLAGRAAHAGTDFGDRAARFEELRAGGAVDRAVHPAAAEHPLVGGVDDRVHRQLGDVRAEDLDARVRLHPISVTARKSGGRGSGRAGLSDSQSTQRLKEATKPNS